MSIFKLLRNGGVSLSPEIFKANKEKETFFAIAKSVLSKLSNDVILSHDSYQTVVEKGEHPVNITVGRLGIGIQSRLKILS